MSAVDRASSSEKKPTVTSKAKVDNPKAEIDPKDGKFDVKPDVKIELPKPEIKIQCVKPEIKRQDSNGNRKAPTLKKDSSFDSKKDGAKDGKVGDTKRTDGKKERPDSLKRDTKLDSPKGRTESIKKHDCSKNVAKKAPIGGRGRGTEGRAEGEGIPRLQRQASQEEPEVAPVRRRSNPRSKLSRSQPVSDDSSPPQTPDLPLTEQAFMKLVSIQNTAFGCENGNRI